MENRTFIKGADISTIFEEIECGAKYFDVKEGTAISAGEFRDDPEEVLTILKRYGFNSVRIRLWNDPYSNSGEKYGAGTNDIDKALRLAKLSKDAGMSILFDFHYSDFWADPGKQTMPKAWEGLSVPQLEQKVSEFTEYVMNRLVGQGTAPEYVQVGNELTNGLMWPVAKKPWKPEDYESEYGNGYDNIARFVSAGIRAVRKVSPETKIMIHLDNGGNNAMYRDWFDNYFSRDYAEDFDIIGMSYYPFWHGTLPELDYNMHDMAERYGKEIVIAEVSMGFTMEDYGSYEGLAPSDRKGMATRRELCEKLEYPMTKEGQSDFMNDFMNRVRKVNGSLGFYYWEPAWIPVPGCGWATDAALAYTKEKGPGGNEWANQALFDFDGKVLPALETIRNF